MKDQGPETLILFWADDLNFGHAKIQVRLKAKNMCRPSDKQAKTKSQNDKWNIGHPFTERIV